MGELQLSQFNYNYYPLLGSCYVYCSTINQLPTQEGEKVRISTVVRVEW